MTHESAQDYCKSLDERAQLAEIKTQEVQEFVEGLLDLQSHYWWWFGGIYKAKI